MSVTPISLIQRIQQANTRMQWIARCWYLGKMTTAQFEAERKEILDFIDTESRVPDSDVELDADMHELVMPVPKAAQKAG